MGRAFAMLAMAILIASQAQAAGRELELTVQGGDTLIALAERFLAKPAEWPKLQRLNRVADPKRLVPGSTLRIPVEWLRENAERMEVIAVSGTAAKGDGTKLAVGERLAPETSIRTGDDGFVTLRAPDGSLIALQPKSDARLASIGRYVNTDIFSTVVRMVSGRVEAVVEKLRGPSRFEVQTDLAVAGVRGTRFRVAADAGPRPRAQAEVLEGQVEFAGGAKVSGASAVALAAGFGSVTDDAGNPRPPTSLLPAPQITAADALQERLVTRFRFPAIAGAGNYRAQVARDQDFRAGIAEGVFTAPEIKFADLADGEYFLRARASDTLGLEGRDAVFAFRLKARPEPPLTTAPAANGKVRATSTEFTWASNPEAASYRIQISEDEVFARIVQDETVTGETFTSKAIPFGEYFWRVRSIKDTGSTPDAGPWGDVRKFTLRPPPKTPEPPEESASGLAFSWTAEPGQTFVFQVAGDANFANMVDVRNLTEPRVTLPRPAQGTYFLRVRATDPDGFVGPFTAPQRFMVINRVRDSGGANLSTSDGQPVRLQ
jgi:hypothetical protein